MSNAQPDDAVLLAVDWGTTNCRAWTVDAAGAPLTHKAFALGVSKLERGEAGRRFVDVVRPAMGADHLPTLMTGMIGSTLGWIEAPYADCPADAAALARNLVSPPATGEPAVRIVPGLRCQGITGAPDVMRGEETQIIGWLAGDDARRKGSHMVCHPGTHAKWARLVDGRIECFVTAMTGELFDVLGAHSVLRFPADLAESEAAFDEGVAAAGDGGALAARLFSARSRIVGGGSDAASAKSYLSGLLIGADVAAAPGLIDIETAQTIALIGDERLCALYGRALSLHGRRFTRHSGDEAVLMGLAAIHRLADA